MAVIDEITIAQATKMMRTTHLFKLTTMMTHSIRVMMMTTVGIPTEDSVDHLVAELPYLT